MSEDAGSPPGDPADADDGAEPSAVAADAADGDDGTSVDESAIAAVEPTVDPAISDAVADPGTASTRSDDGTADADPDGSAAPAGSAASDGSATSAGPAAEADDQRGSVTVVGTAHVSEQSVADVEAAIDEERPDVVAVELDEGRFRQLKGESAADFDPADLLSGNTAFQFLAYWLLSYVQSRLGDRFDIQPGAEMVAAVAAGERVGAEIALIDRDIQVTVQRFWSRMRLREKLALVWQLVAAMVGFGGGAVEDEEFDVDALTDGDVVSALLEEFRRFSPGGAAALIDERDAYLAHNLVALRDAGHDVVAVVGAGHRVGVEAYLADPTTLPPMADLVGPDRRRFSLGRVVGGLVGVAFVTFFVLLAMAGVDDAVLLRLFAAWFLFNGVFAAGLALVAGAHWTSAAVGGLVAWLTSVNPLLAPGWFAGYVELRRRPVNVADVGTLNDILSDTETPAGELLAQLRAVPLFRLILVVALTNVGSIVATFLFPFVVLPLFGPPFDSVGAVVAAMQQGIDNSAAEVLRWAGAIWGTVA
ncbi:MAG: TraB/GumN family protein [Halobacteriaceae archaeon]